MAIIVVLALCGVLGMWIGSTKHRAGLGFALGFFLGVIGLLVIALLPKEQPQIVYVPYMPQTQLPDPRIGNWPPVQNRMPAASSTANT